MIQIQIIDLVIQSNAFPLEIMTHILLPQEISQLDTFTLQERIEAIEQMKNHNNYAHILIIAKLELIQRLEIQEFGRKLANDQYFFEQEINLPKIISQPTHQASKYKDGGLQTKKQIVAKLQMNMAIGGSFLKVGKPTVQHRYKPAKATIQPKQTQRKFLKAKKQDILIDKKKFTSLKSISTKKYPIQKQEQKRIKGYIWNNTITQTKKEQVIKKQQTIDVVGQFSLKQKLKKQVELMKIDYRQNDAYDDMKQIMLIPQNLILEQLKLKQLKESQIVTEISQRQQVQPIDRAYDVAIKQNTQFKQNQQNQIIEEIIVQHKDQFEQKHENNQNHKEQQYKFKQQKQKQIQKQKQQIYFTQKTFQKQIKQESQINLQSSSTLQPNLKKYPPIIKPIQFTQIKQNNRQSIKSLKSISKNNYQTMQTSNNDKQQIQIIQNKCDYVNSKTTNYTKINSLKLLGKQQIKNKVQIMKMSSNNFNKIGRPQIFPYHQIIPSFAKLFPHNKNLLITLRNIQQNLKLHFTKSIDERSKNSQYLRLNEHNITFRVISQSQKAKKHANLFNINLDSFYKRGVVMIDRANQNIDEKNEKNENILLYRVVRTKEQVYDIINCSFHRTKNWYQLPHGMQLKMSWNLLWTWSKPQIDLTDLFYFQKVNHFLGNKQIARKDLLKKNIENIKKLNAKMKNYFDIIPQTFLLPGQNIAFIKKFRQYGTKDSLNYWILKPVGLSRGRGIQLVNKLEDVIFSQPVVLQKYISNPLLIDGYKFDMRIYVLVTSINPLQAFIYKQGFARLSTQKYSLDEQLMDNKFIHLTNFSINKQNLNKKEMTDLQSLGGCKITLKMLSQQLQRNGIQWNKIQKQIEQIILKSLISCMNTIPQNPNCFELFGYDIFIDTNLKCWLLQVNSSPSLEKQYTLDQIIKQQLVDDIIQIVNPISYDRMRLLQIVQRRRKQAEGLKSSIITSTNSIWQLDEDLNYILHGKALRKYGEPPSNNNFKLIAPSQRYYSIIKALQQYKVDPIIKGQHINH